MQALEGLVRLIPPAPLNKDVGCHCPMYSNMLATSASARGMLAASIGFPKAQETANVNMWGACRRRPYRPQRRKLLHHVMNVGVA